MITFLRFSMYATIGMVSSIAGLGLDRWEFWVILAASVIIGVCAYFEGIASK